MNIDIPPQHVYLPNVWQAHRQKYIGIGKEKDGSITKKAEVSMVYFSDFKTQNAVPAAQQHQFKHQRDPSVRL